MVSKDTVNLILRLPKPLHKRLKAQAKRNNVSLNTEIVNRLEGPRGAMGVVYKELMEPLINATARAAAEYAAKNVLEEFVERFHEAEAAKKAQAQEVEKK
jgi:HicB family